MSLNVPSDLATTQPYIPNSKGNEKNKNQHGDITFTGALTDVSAASAAYLTAQGVSGFASTGAAQDGMFAAVAVERANIAQGLGIWPNGTRLKNMVEDGASRSWSLATGGSNAANAAASHARNVSLGQGATFLLPNDNNRVLAAAGLPASGTGINGDLSVDWASGTLNYRDNITGIWAFNKNVGSVKQVATASTQAIVASGYISNIPETPTNVLAVAGEASAKVYFESSVRGLTYSATSTSGTTITGSTSPLVFPSLTNGAAQAFTLTAVNAASNTVSAPVVSNTVTPTALPAVATGIPNVMALFDADALPVVANGTALASWTDLSGNGRTLSQATTAQQPLYVTSANWGSAASGHPAVKFDGVSGAALGDYMSGSLTAKMTGTQITVIAVLSATALTNASGAGDMRILTNELNPRDRGFALTCNSANTGGGSGTNFPSVKGGTNEVNPGASQLVANTPVIVSVVVGKQMFVNGTRSVPQLGTIAALLPRKQPFCVGACVSNSGNLNFAGSIAFLMIVRGQMTDAQRNAIESALATRYGLTVATQATV